MTTRIIPRSTVLICAFNGRTYLGSTGWQDVPDGDAAVLTTNGWVAFGVGGHGLSGTTSERPVPGGGSYYDETLGETVTWLPDWPALGVNGHWVSSTGSEV